MLRYLIVFYFCNRSIKKNASIAGIYKQQGQIISIDRENL